MTVPLDSVDIDELDRERHLLQNDELQGIPDRKKNAPIAEIHARFQLTEPCDLIGHHPHKWNIPTQTNSKQ